MTKPAKKAASLRAAKLRNQINDLRYRYHVLDDPTVSDDIYDSLTRELRAIEATYPALITPDSPTQRVGGKALEKFESVSHQQPMLSLNDAFSEAEFTDWAKRIYKLTDQKHLNFHVDIKMDGLACALIYENGLLVRGVTRGDGYIGEDVTQNVRTIEAIPLKLRTDKTIVPIIYQSRVEVRGEVIIYKKDFEKINQERSEQGLPTFANPRNLAAGSVRQLDPKLTAARRLRFRAYALLTNTSQPTLNQEYELARQLGFAVNSQHKLARSEKEVLDYIRVWEKKRYDLPFQVDGLVVAVDDREQFDQLGVVGKAPRGAIAYKYPAEQATTKVKDIIVSIGRTGAATPVAVMEPVRVAGSTVQFATLHNEDEVKRKDVRIGDTVVIRKAGDVIPEIVSSLPKLRSGHEKVFKMPTKCPVCNTKLVKIKAEEAIWRCPNLNCPSRLRGQLLHFVSKEALDIEGLGEKNAQLFLKQGLIHDVADLYALKASAIEQLDRFAQKSANKIVAAIQAKRQVPIDRFLFGLGIRHVGRQTAIDLTNHFGSLENMEKASLEDFEQVAGIGSIVAHSIYTWFHEADSVVLLDKLAKVGVKPIALKTSGKLAGKSFAITGTLDSISREAAADKIRALGGKFQNAVGRDTDYLVVGKEPGENKISEAAKYKTKRIDEKELLRLIK